MRKHGWQLPYHPLQVVAVAVFLALGFAFYVFFAPFVGRKLFQHIVMGIYTPLITCAFSLYIWCAAADPADQGVFRSKKYPKKSVGEKEALPNVSKPGGESTSSIQDANASTVGAKSLDKETSAEAASKDSGSATEMGNESSRNWSCFPLVFSPCLFFSKCCASNEESSGQQMSEEGLFYCSLCEVEVYKYSKHCRVCDKCVDRFDHHCRWLNNCIGKRNYRPFFTLMVSALLLLILQWSTGILVLVRCFLEHKRFSVDIPSKLGSSFSLVPFVIVVAVCTILAMVATLPLVQLFFFHILLIKKGISTYDYIMALREQEQEQQGVGAQQSSQMSPASSITGLSSASSFSTFRRGAWCTPPRLFLEDQFDVVPPDTGSVSSYGKKSFGEEPIKRKNPAPVKISPWTLARLNAEEISKAAAEARKKSKVLQPVVRRETPVGLMTDRSFGSSSRRMAPRPENNKKRVMKRVRLAADLAMEQAAKVTDMGPEKDLPETSSFAPLRIEARNAFQTSKAMSSSYGIVSSSPESSIDSPDIHPFQVSSSGAANESRSLAGAPAAGTDSHNGIPLSRSTSDGYEASGGEDSDRVPSRTVERSSNWSDVLFRSDQEQGIARFKASSSSQTHNRKI